MTELLMTVAVFNAMVMFLVAAILIARHLISGSSVAHVEVEGHGVVHATLGERLLGVLTAAGLPVPATCGGRGTCGQCRVRVRGPADPPLPMELGLIEAHAIARGTRLACQVIVRGDIVVGLPEGLPAQQPLQTRVRTTRNLTPLIKELVLELPPDVPFAFRAGSFVQVTCPPGITRLRDVAIDEPYRARWAQLGVDALEASREQPVTRAYSLANHPAETGIAMLVVRLALPPAGSPPGTPPGIVSSYLFGLAPGDPVEIAGPFGHFVADETDAEMIFVGGGAGMAPMRAHIFEQLKVLRAQRKISFWYGARSRSDLVYDEEFKRLADEHDNFRWSVALSEPADGDDWDGPVGFVHQHLLDAYLSSHPAPGACEYYLCGPPLMIRAVTAMLDDLGVEPRRVHYDDFGG